MSRLRIHEWKGFEAVGNLSLIDHPKVAVLNSSQGKQPTGSKPCVSGTVRAYTSIDSDQVAITSVGINSWELSCHLAQCRGVSQICLVPLKSNNNLEEECEEILSQFDLDPGTVCFLGVSSQLGSVKGNWLKRDALAIDLADTVLPVSIRKGGKIENLILDLARQKKVCTDFQAEWEKSEPRQPYYLDPEWIAERFGREMKGWVFHWTRAADGSWPGEKKSEYYRDVLTSDKEYSRSARLTLERILSEGKIRASSRRIRGKSKVVAFSGLPPSESGHLFTWRKRYARFNAEPFGVGIHPDFAKEIGIQPVVYLRDGRSGGEAPVHLRQSAGIVGDWPRERESRCLGDVDLSILPDEGYRGVTLVEAGS
ncbi:MAG: hypothetical protein KC917_03985 [Candidatus Omnitrophica bacterium]|nr:hypothetical protein [Candidatus Omnitrophota bacterium]